jgi:hypothetical protein
MDLMDGGKKCGWLQGRGIKSMEWLEATSIGGKDGGGGQKKVWS